MNFQLFAVVALSQFLVKFPISRLYHFMKLRIDAYLNERACKVLICWENKSQFIVKFPINGLHRFTKLPIDAYLNERACKVLETFKTQLSFICLLEI